MRTAKYFVLATLTLTMVGLGLFEAREKDKAKFTIKQVMKMAHKDGLLKKVTDGEATKAEKEKLLELYTALSMNKPPRGDDKDWKDKTSALIKAAKEVVEGDKDGTKDLIKATKCKACHELHKGS
jgi:hypothetical protein